MKQLIIARKDLNMSPGKLAAQVSHASMAFLTNEIRNSDCDFNPEESIFMFIFQMIFMKIGFVAFLRK